MELATGIALWASPPQIKIPGMLALAALRGIRAKLRERDEESSPGGNNSDGSHSKDEVVVRWDDVRMTLQPTKKDKKKLGADAKPKRILDGVSGTAKPGRLLAIMGPSGSGKTSLLNALAAQVPKSNRISLCGTLRHNATSVGEDTRRNRRLLNDTVAYVQQQDVFYSQLTVRETLETAAAMRMPKSRFTEADRKEAVDAALRSMGIAHVAEGARDDGRPARAAAEGGDVLDGGEVGEEEHQRDAAWEAMR